MVWCNTSRSISLAPLLVLGLVAPLFAAEPNWEAEPYYGTVELEAGFEPDPWQGEMEAGGEFDARSIARGCAGFINGEKPDYDLNYEADGEQLSFYVTGASRLTLVIYTPDEEWICADGRRSASSFVTLPDPASGNYNIWIGTREQGATTAVTLGITERELTDGGQRQPQQPSISWTAPRATGSADEEPYEHASSYQYQYLDPNDQTARQGQQADGDTGALLMQSVLETVLPILLEKALGN